MQLHHILVYVHHIHVCVHHLMVYVHHILVYVHHILVCVHHILVYVHHILVYVLTALFSRYVTDNHAPCHFIPKHVRTMHACLAVTCHLHFWQNDRDLFRASAVTRERNGYRNSSQLRKMTLEKNIMKKRREEKHSPAVPARDSNPQPFDHELIRRSITTELSPLP